ncbi:hypothetical protein WR25_05198 isoform A [Diploscapter pachys]|uniref:C2H2-type domain-containing protein n=1 Tax=Diploscapter pachys TaxID=2018661 RepID=A0A2A2JD13_9BILA|nr:hypothetical protein WR25_05198 isoform A [Diploscapter pachys]
MVKIPNKAKSNELERLLNLARQGLKDNSNQAAPSQPPQNEPVVSSHIPQNVALSYQATSSSSSNSRNNSNGSAGFDTRIVKIEPSDRNNASRNTVANDSPVTMNVFSRRMQLPINRVQSSNHQVCNQRQTAPVAEPQGVFSENADDEDHYPTVSSLIPQGPTSISPANSPVPAAYSPLFSNSSILENKPMTLMQNHTQQQNSWIDLAMRRGQNAPSTSAQEITTKVVETTKSSQNTPSTEGLREGESKRSTRKSAKRFDCKKCGMTTDKAHRRDHALVHLLRDEKWSTYLCKVSSCDFKHYRPFMMKDHRRKAHPGQNDAGTEKVSFDESEPKIQDMINQCFDEAETSPVQSARRKRRKPERLGMPPKKRRSETGKRIRRPAKGVKKSGKSEPTVNKQPRTSLKRILCMVSQKEVSFQSSTHMLQHFETHMKDFHGLRRYHCCSCDHQSVHRSGITTHLQGVHNGGDYTDHINEWTLEMMNDVAQKCFNNNAEMIIERMPIKWKVVHLPDFVANDENTDDTVMNESSGDRGSEPEPEPEPEFELENEPGSAPEPVEMDISEQSEELENIGADVTTSFGWKGTSNESDREADDRNLDEEYDSDEYSEPFYRI